MTIPAAAPAGPLPAALRWAVRLIAAEAAAVGAVAAFLVHQDLTATATDLTAALVVTACAVAIAALLAALAYRLSRRRAGARGPAVVLQLMLLPIAFYMVQGGLPLVGVPVGLLGVVVIQLLIARSTTRALGLSDAGSATGSDAGRG